MRVFLIEAVFGIRHIHAVSRRRYSTSVHTFDQIAKCFRNMSVSSKTLPLTIDNVISLISVGRPFAG